ncbi:hypothetical protein H4R35_001752 [Dimargaris xerosporica]|nr:hypothetical protein H4R35_001752 [Dimargaris xerosporica]
MLLAPLLLALGLVVIAQALSSSGSTPRPYITTPFPPYDPSAKDSMMLPLPQDRTIAYKFSITDICNGILNQFNPDKSLTDPNIRVPSQSKVPSAMYRMMGLKKGRDYFAATFHGHRFFPLDPGPAYTYFCKNDTKRMDTLVVRTQHPSFLRFGSTPVFYFEGCKIPVKTFNGNTSQDKNGCFYKQSLSYPVLLRISQFFSRHYRSFIDKVTSPLTRSSSPTLGQGQN